jgi:hypothetical protein
VSLAARFLSLLGFNSIIPAEVRAEAWALGGRHLGEVTAGARRELKAPGVTSRRRVLLLAVIRNQESLDRCP